MQVRTVTRLLTRARQTSAVCKGDSKAGMTTPTTTGAAEGRESTTSALIPKDSAGSTLHFKLGALHRGPQRVPESSMLRHRRATSVTGRIQNLGQAFKDNGPHMAAVQ